MRKRGPSYIFSYFNGGGCFINNSKMCNLNNASSHTDSGYGVICWFEKFFNRIKCRRSQFGLLNYGLFFKPQQGTLTLFKTAEVNNQTI